MIELTQDQQYILQEAVRWYQNDTASQVFQISGPPGSGKTILIKAIMDALNINPSRVMPMAYTGCASLVLRTRGFYNAKTIHSSLYDIIDVPLLDYNGKPRMDSYFNTPIMRKAFIPKKELDTDLIIIDEGSFVPMSMKADIERFGKKIIVAGDLDQLPPVNDNPAYLYSGKVYRLRQIMRQAQNSAIVYLSQLAINDIPINVGMYGKDVMVIKDTDLTDEMLRYACVTLCGKNTTRDYYNTRIRKIRNHYSATPGYMERVIFRRNDWANSIDNINITNGLMGTVLNDPGPLDNRKGVFRIDFLPDLSNIVFPNLEINYEYFCSDYKTRQKLKEVPTYKSEAGTFLEFGYSITTHLSQGSEYPNGIYVEEYLNKDINRNLNYTAITRFRNHLIYVKRTKN